MKIIEVDEELYRYIASHTQHIGESASDILRRMLMFSTERPLTTALPAVQELEQPIAACSQDGIGVVNALLNSDEYCGQKKAVNRFMLILSTLYHLDPHAFMEATTSLQGRTRVYFADDEQTLSGSGVHTKPKQVPDTPYWVITNTNTGRKRSMVQHIMLVMQLPQKLVNSVCDTI